jgi:hypothetical protein
MANLSVPQTKVKEALAGHAQSRIPRNRNSQVESSRLAPSRCGRKNIPLVIFRKSAIIAASRLGQGRIAIVTTREAGMRWTRMCLLTSGTDADGEIVWSWRPRDLALKFALMRSTHHAGDGGKRDGSPRRARISRKTIAQGRPECIRLYLWFSRSRNLFLRGSPGCSGHPAFPAPSVYREGEMRCKARAKCVARMRMHGFGLVGPILRDAAFAAPQDEVVTSGQGQTLMVRSAAKPRDSNHEAPTRDAVSKS